MQQRRAPGELVLADLIGGQRSGPRGAAEERGEMGDPAAGGGAGFQPPLRASSDSCNNAPSQLRLVDQRLEQRKQH